MNSQSVQTFGRLSLQMWRSAVERSGTSTLYFGLVLSHLVGGGGALTVFAQRGQQVTLPCPYHYEDHAPLSQLSVQWRGPNNSLLCHFIKHKSFTNCSAGYSLLYSPASITLAILHANVDDFGTHVCSVSKRHEFSDYRVELSWAEEVVTSAPNRCRKHEGSSWTLLFLPVTLFVCR